MAFAQSSGMTWNGYVDFGALITSSGGTTNLDSYGTDAWSPGRFQLEGKYSADNYGLAFRLRNDGAWDAAQNNTNVKRAYGWVDLANGMVKINAGMLGDYTWSTGGWESFGNFDGKTGLQVQIMPTKGANLGVFIPTWTTAAGSDTLSNVMQAISLGASYSTDMMYLAAGYDLGNSTLWVGGSYSGMKDLTLEVESNNSFATGAQSYYFDEYVDYNLGTMTVGTYAEQYIPTGGTFAMHFSPQFTYTVDKLGFTVRADYAMQGSDSGYGVGAQAKLSVADNAWVSFGGGFDGGTLAPTDASQTIGAALYGDSAITTQASTTLLRAFVDVGTKF
jgi:hypothetical protein